MDIAQLLAFSVKNGASDLHLSAGLPPMIRVDGDVRRINVDPMDHEMVHGMVYDIMNDKQRKTFEEYWETDFSFEIPGLARFRVNAFNHNRGAGAVFRTIPSKILSLEELNAPKIFESISNTPRGIVLVKGIPFKIGAVPLTDDEQSEIDALVDERKRLSGQLEGLANEAEKKSVKAALAAVKRKIRSFRWRHNTSASVDSELMMVLMGYHIASQECQTLRAGNSQVWCKRMLEEGVAVTIGPMGEPYVQAFPLPEIFFGTLVEGRLTVAECYLLSVPYLSWKMVLVGDPLYRPFRK